MGTPEIKILASRNDQFSDVRPLLNVVMHKWENENWETVTFGAGYRVNDRSVAVPYFVVPVQKGKHSVYIELSGHYDVQSLETRQWEGFIAYDKEGTDWRVQEYVGIKISNYADSQTFTEAHKDSELNGCHFQPGRGVYVDAAMSFHLNCPGDEGSFIIQAPTYQKSDKFNYTVSYGALTDRLCRIGDVSISIDEMDAAGPSKSDRLRRRDLTPKDHHYPSDRDYQARTLFFRPPRG